MRSKGEPRYRGKLYMAVAVRWFTLKRKLLWLRESGSFAVTARDDLLPFVYASHSTPMLRKLRNLDMELQINKVTNLRLAAERLDGILLPPGKTLSFWYLVGKPSYRRGFLDGMVLRNGKIERGPGGGLCQMSNLIYWMTIHTPLTVAERHRHGYDVFPDSGRTQPFASGATVFYPYVDLAVRNDTDTVFQLHLYIDGDRLCGEWRSEKEPEFRYEVIEKDHTIKSEFWGGYTRHNALWRNVFDNSGSFLREEFITENDALMLYSPLLSDGSDPKDYVK
ncbi:MAG: VanW family protein [Clostridia bacterium]|nr:VanW family protein [Clostridia bacterium]